MKKNPVMLFVALYITSCGGEPEMVNNVEIRFVGIDTTRPYEQGESLPFELEINNGSDVGVCISAEGVGVTFFRAIEGDPLYLNSG